MTQSLTLRVEDLSEFDDGGRFLDLRIAERLEFPRARDIRPLVRSHLTELQRYGPVCEIISQTSIQGGRPGAEYWLNEPQSLLICMRSDAPRAPDVREEIINVCMAYRRGYLVAPSAALNLQMIGQLFDEKLVPIQLEISEIRDNVIFLSKRVDDIVPLREFSESTKRRWYHVCRVVYLGECPSCRERKIVNDHGMPINGVLNHDHFRGRELNGPEDGWPVCAECNQKLKNSQFKESKRKRFLIFQEDMQRLWTPHRQRKINKSQLPIIQHDLFGSQ